MAFLYDSRIPTPPMTSTFARRKADDYPYPTPATGSQAPRYAPPPQATTTTQYAVASTSTGGYQYSTQTYQHQQQQQQQHYPQTTQTHTPVEHHQQQSSSTSVVYEQGQQQQRPTLPPIAHLERNLPPLTPPDEVSTSQSHPRVEDDVFMGAPSSSASMHPPPTQAAVISTHHYQQTSSPYHPPPAVASSSQQSSAYSYSIPTSMPPNAASSSVSYATVPVHSSTQAQSQSHSHSHSPAYRQSASQNAVYVQQPPQQYHPISQVSEQPQSQQPQPYYQPSETHTQTQYSQPTSHSHPHAHPPSQPHQQYQAHPAGQNHARQPEPKSSSAFPVPPQEIEPEVGADSALALLPSSSFVSSSTGGPAGPAYINGSGTGPAQSQSSLTAMTVASNTTTSAAAIVVQAAPSVPAPAAGPTMGRNPSTTNGLVVVDWLDFTRTRSAHFIAEKTCEMICYLWFAASGGSVSALGRRQRDATEREREQQQREKSRERREREKSRERSDHAMESMSTPPPTPPSKRRLLSPPASVHGGAKVVAVTASPTDTTAISATTSAAPSAPSTLQLIATPTFVAFMQKLLETTQVSQSVIVLSLHYIYRLKERSKFTPAQAGSEFRIAVAGLMMANKFLDDNTYTNKTWSEVSGIDLSEINRMEREFLQGVDFNLYVDIATYQTWLNLLKGLVLAKERDSRRWAYGRHGNNAAGNGLARRGAGIVGGQRPMAHIGGAGSRTAAYANGGASAARRGSGGPTLSASVQQPLRTGSYGNLASASASNAKVYASSSAASAAFKSQQQQAQQRQQQATAATVYAPQPSSQPQVQSQPQQQYRSMSTSPTPMPRAVYMPHIAAPAPKPAAPVPVPVVEKEELTYPASTEPSYYSQQQQPSLTAAPVYSVQPPPASAPVPAPAQQYVTPITTTTTPNTHLHPHHAHSYDEAVSYNTQAQPAQAPVYVSTGNPYPPSYPTYPSHSTYASYPSGTSSAYTSPSPAPSAVHASSGALASRQPPLGMARLNTALAQQAQVQAQQQQQSQPHQQTYAGAQAEQAHIQGILQRKRTAEAAFSPTSVAFRDADVQLPPSKTRARPVSFGPGGASISLRIPEGLSTPGASASGISAGASASPLDGFNLQSFSRMSLGTGPVASPAKERDEHELEKERERAMERQRERDWESDRLAPKMLSSTYTYSTDERRAAAPQNLYFYTLACSPLKEELSSDKDREQEAQKEDGSGYGYRKARLRYHQPNMSANAPYAYADLNATTRGVGVAPPPQATRPTTSYTSYSQAAPAAQGQAQYAYLPASATTDIQPSPKHLHPHYHQADQTRVVRPNPYPAAVQNFQDTPPRLIVQSAVSSPAMMRTRPNFGSTATLPIFRDDVWARPPAPAHTYQHPGASDDMESDEESSSDEEDDDEEMEDDQDEEDQEDEVVYTRPLLSSTSSTSTIKYAAPQKPQTPPPTTTPYSYSHGGSSYSNANIPSAPFANAGPPGVGVRFYDDQTADISSSPLRPSTHHASSYHFSSGQYYQQAPPTQTQASYGQSYGAYTGNGVYGYIPGGGPSGSSGYSAHQS